MLQNKANKKTKLLNASENNNNNNNNNNKYELYTYID